MSIQATLQELANKLNDAFGQHTQQLADRRSADFDHNTQLGLLHTEVGALRRELRGYRDETMEAIAQLKELILANGGAHG